MAQLFRLATALLAVGALAFPLAANAGHTSDPRTPNLIPLGHVAEEDTATISDLAFWRNYAFEGSYDGFRILDISNPMAPSVVTDYTCGQSQGDLTISPDGNILIRSQDTAEVLPGNDINQACHPGLPGFTAAQRTAQGWEGLQIFDVSNKAAPRFVAAVATDCGSHTHTQVHDEANNRLIIYVSRSGGGAGATTPYGTACTPTIPKITAVEVPLANPAGARVINNNIVAGVNGCHDVAVYEGIDRLFGACRPHMIMWDISDPANPTQLWAVTHPAVQATQGATGGWHTATMSWNGEIAIGGWEPGGGSNPRCTALDPPTEKSYYFFDADNGALLGTYLLPRNQGLNENCTLHNTNVVPFVDRHVLVHGSYRSGTAVVDFTNPAAPREIAYSDPDAPTSPATCGSKNPPGVTGSCVLGGSWSTYWYNDLMYESDIQEGLNIWDLAEPWWENALSLPYLNPQTQEDRIVCSVTAASSLRARRSGTVTVRVRAWAQGVPAVRVRLAGAGVNRLARTNASGVATVRIRPSRAGTLRVGVRDTLNMEGCATTRRVAAAPRRGGGGPGLTGRPARA